MNDDYRMFDEVSDDGEAVDPDTALISAYLARELPPVQAVAVQRRLANDPSFARLFESILEAWSVPIPGWSPATVVDVSSVVPPTREELDRGWQRFEESSHVIASYPNVIASHPSFAKGESSVVSTASREVLTTEVTEVTEGSPSVTSVTSVVINQRGGDEKTKSIVRIAATILAIVLPVALSAQLVLYVANNSAAPGHKIASAIVSPFVKSTPAAVPVQSAAPVAPPRSDSITSLNDGPIPIVAPINELPAPRQQSAARSIVEEMRITTNDASPQTMIVSVESVVAADDGTIFIADRGAGQIKVYDANGKYVRGFGRLGQGPGEFSPNNGFLIEGVVGDTVRVQDITKRHVLVFLRNGTYLRTEAATGPAGVAMRAYLGDGHSLVRNIYQSNRPAGPGPLPPADSQNYVVMDSSRRVIARVAVEPGRDRGTSSIRNLVRENGQTYSKSWEQPFIREIYGERDPRARRGLVLIPDTRFGGAPGQVKIVIVTKAGIESERVVDLGARRLTTAIRDAWIRKSADAIAADVRRAGLPSGVATEMLRNEVKMPAFLPTFDEGRLGADGSIWIKLFESEEWLVLPPGRAPSFRVRVPAGIRVDQVAVDKMWGTVRDADGLPSVVRYRVSNTRLY